VRGGARGFALVRGDVLDLADPRDVARLPHPDPELAATYLSDLLALPEAGDLVVQGWRGEGREIVAYAWEFGSHGGIAPEELECFVAHPAGCEIPFADALRPSELHHWLERVRGGIDEEEGGRDDELGVVGRGDGGLEAPPP
jgi:hypothetical protein